MSMSCLLSLVILLGSALSSLGHESKFAPLNLHKATVRRDPSISLTADPSTIHATFGWVTVKFSGVENPNKDDWIGVYSPANANVSTTSPVKYQVADFDKGYLSSGAGVLKFRLINLRADYSFSFFRMNHDQDSVPVAVATSNSVAFSNYDAPTGGHLALTHDNTQMIVSWTSKSAVNPQVKVGTSSGVYSADFDAISTTYTRAMMCGGAASGFGWRDPGFLNNALLLDLIPGQEYFYVYGDEMVGGWSDESRFRAAPAVGSESNVKLIAYGDMGKAESDGSLEHWEEDPSLNTTRNVIKKINDIDLVLHIGDISYAVGFSAQWDEFFEQVEPVASRVPYMTCIGNHERDFPGSGSFYNGTDSGGECGVAYERRLVMPRNSMDAPWYSFDYGNIHFTIFSTEHDFRSGSTQHQWFEGDLKSVDRNKTPWLIVAGHRPMYIDSTDDEGVASDLVVAKLMRESLESLMYKYHVDMALWGHHHSYQRTCPVYQEQCNQAGPVHVVIGMAGMGLDNDIPTKNPNWLVFVDDMQYGYTHFETTSTTLDFKFFANSNHMRDHFTLKKH